jgi:hypothetical protein
VHVHDERRNARRKKKNVKRDEKKRSVRWI